MNLFQLGDFTLSSGQRSNFKIECDALTAADWQALAAMLADALPSFGDVVGVVRGGVPLAMAMRNYATRGPLLIVDDVLTTGRSMQAIRDAEVMAGEAVIGAVVFARGPCPEWITPLFAMPQTVQLDKER